MSKANRFTNDFAKIWWRKRIAIDSYKEMIQYFGTKDPTTRRMIEGILSVEEEHAEDLATLLETN